MDRFSLLTPSSPHFGTRRKQSGHHHHTRPTPYGQGSSSLRARLSSDSIDLKAAASQPISEEEQAFRDQMDNQLQYIYNSPEDILRSVRGNRRRRQNQSQDQWFLRFYQDTHLQKLEERHQLRQALKEKQSALQASQDREKQLGPIAKWPVCTGAALGLGVESAIHISSMGASALILPPGAVTAMGAVAGKLLGGMHSPRSLENQVGLLQQDLEDLDVYLHNLRAVQRIVAKRQGKQPATHAGDSFQRQSQHQHQEGESRYDFRQRHPRSNETQDMPDR